MMLSFYFFIIPILLVVIYFGVKLFVHRKQVKNIDGGLEDNNINEAFSSENFEEAKEIVFVFFDNARENFVKIVKIFFHWLLHLFVIFLGLISDLTDILYSKARDFFLHTATKEKDVVSKFWHTLKEYKKEKESEKEELDNSSK